jgi:hypothetical protein
MPTILPQPTTPQPLPSGAPAVPIATVINAPSALLQLPVGVQLPAEIIQVLARGLVEAQTDFGSVQLRTNIPLPEGAKVNLQVLRTTPQLQFAVQPEAATHRTFSRNAPSATIQPPGPLTQGAVAATQTAASVTLPGLAVGAVIRATIAAPASGPVPQSNLPSSPAGAIDEAAASAASKPTAAVPHRPPNPAPSFEVRITALAPAGQSLPAPVSPNTLSGVVTAFISGGRPAVQTPLGIITLEALPVDARIGSQIQFTLAPLPPQRAASSLLALDFPETFVQTRTWPALDEAIAHLAHRPAESNPAQLPLPQANRQSALNIMLVLAALRSGDARAWLGDSATILENERPDLAGRLNEEFVQLARAFNEAPANDWRTALIPFFNGAHLEPVQMHLRGGKSEKGDRGEDEGARFIIDVELSHLGRVQLDGFIKKHGSDRKTFDLIVRTDRLLPQQMRLDIHHIFSAFGEAAGLSGALTFQARGQFVDVALSRITQATKSGLIV